MLDNIEKGVDAALDHVDNLNIKMRKTLDGVSISKLGLHGTQPLFTHPVRFSPRIDDERRPLYGKLHPSLRAPGSCRFCCESIHYIDEWEGVGRTFYVKI